MLDMDPVARATGYPYDSPSGSFLFDTATGTTGSLPAAGTGGWSDGRHPVLAIGSNAAPRQLAWKLRDVVGDPRVPVRAVTLRDHDVVFAAHVASYGSVPATVVRCPGVVVDVKLLLLTAAQLERMDASESLGRVYDTEAIDRRHLTIEGEPLDANLDSVPAYVARAGPLPVGGAPIALDAIRASGRSWPATSQPRLLARLAAALDHDVDGFIRRVIADAGFRSDLNARLAGPDPRLGLWVPPPP